MTIEDAIPFGRQELSAVYKMLDCVNYFAHQPLHYDAEQMREFNESYSSSLVQVIALLRQKVGTTFHPSNLCDARSIHKQLVVELLAVFQVFANVVGSQDPSTKNDRIIKSAPAASA